MKLYWTYNLIGPFLGALVGCAIFIIPTTLALGLYRRR